MRLVFLVLFVFLLSACEFSTTDDAYDNLEEPSERKPSSVSGNLPAINIGKSWTVVKQEMPDLITWNRSEPMKVVGGYVQFTERKLQSDGKISNIDLQITFGGNDQVRVMQKKEGSDLFCYYNGRIWEEPDLDSFEAFTEDTDPTKRPAFYRIVKGTYSCEGEEVTRSWAAKIDE